VKYYLSKDQGGQRKIQLGRKRSKIDFMGKLRSSIKTDLSLYLLGQPPNTYVLFDRLY
jgi:hypothetical protein